MGQPPDELPPEQIIVRGFDNVVGTLLHIVEEGQHPLLCRIACVIVIGRGLLGSSFVDKSLEESTDQVLEGPVVDTPVRQLNLLVVPFGSDAFKVQACVQDVICITPVPSDLKGPEVLKELGEPVVELLNVILAPILSWLGQAHRLDLWAQRPEGLLTHLFSNALAIALHREPSVPIIAWGVAPEMLGMSVLTPIGALVMSHTKHIWYSEHGTYY